jgi:hypothetical protein
MRENFNLIFKPFSLSVLLTIALLLTRSYTLDHLYATIRKLKGTSIYSGETLATENFQILISIIYPILLLSSFIVVLLFRQKTSKKT